MSVNKKIIVKNPFVTKLFKIPFTKKFLVVYKGKLTFAYIENDPEFSNVYYWRRFIKCR